MPDRWLNVRQDEGTSNPDVWVLIYGVDVGVTGEHHDILFRFNKTEDSQWMIDQLRRCADELEVLL